ncbi:keratin, type I cytoskeletal 9-like [Tigriopus californicus]|uniref:keratin, type I cytoskeletal 9-like n=1 Tax=Tigriopus californicus TaxID=6832 RepID=UPI0027DA89BD|nr:keratin, type I cytoskeletal 9-like [Tigriopus californicus]
MGRGFMLNRQQARTFSSDQIVVIFAGVSCLAEPEPNAEPRRGYVGGYRGSLNGHDRGFAGYHGGNYAAYLGGFGGGFGGYGGTHGGGFGGHQAGFGGGFFSGGHGYQKRSADAEPKGVVVANYPQDAYSIEYVSSNDAHTIGKREAEPGFRYGRYGGGYGHGGYHGGRRGGYHRGYHGGHHRGYGGYAYGGRYGHSF